MSKKITPGKRLLRVRKYDAGVFSDSIGLFLQEEVRKTTEKSFGKYRSMAEFVLKNGRPFAPQPYHPLEWHWQGVEKKCFANSQYLTTKYPDRLRYVEGYCIPAGLSVRVVIPHAWRLMLRIR